MNRKNILLFTLCCALLSPTQVFSHTPKGGHRTKTRVASRSARVNRNILSRLEKMAERASVVRPVNFQTVIPPRLSRSVFEVQISTDGAHTGTAFALDIKGHIYGVTAAHVAENIKIEPFAKVKTENEVIVKPISFLRIGDQRGNDVAIFEVPPEILAHVDVLSPVEQRPTVGEYTQSPKYVWGAPSFLREDILFVGKHRILLRDLAQRDITGACGSPVLAGGKVIGIHIGEYSLQKMQYVSWNTILRENNISFNSPLHVVSPITHVLRLAEQSQGASNVGTMLKVLGHPVHLLTPQEHIISIMHLRNGTVQKEFHAHPFMNYSELGEFFDLQDNDLIRVKVRNPRGMGIPSVTTVYEINVSTGKVSLLTT